MGGRDDVIRELFAMGRTDEEIGKAVGLSVRSVRNERGRLRLVRAGVPHPENLQAKPKLDREYIAQEFAGVDSIPTIAAALGAHPDSVRRILRDELGLVENGHHPPVDLVKLAEADKLLDGTIPYREVAATVGLKQGTLERKLPRRGLKTENYGAMRAARELAEGLGL